MSPDEIIQAALKQVLSDSGSGASVDDPRRLGRIHPLLAPKIEHALISGIYGDKDKDWFEAGRRYYKDTSVCEQLIRVGRNPKPDWAKPDHVYSMFFEISQLTDSAPIPDDFRKAAIEVMLKMPVPDASFVSRFPLTAIKAHDAKEAARTIAGYLAQAQAAGWKVGSARALVEEWRNEYDLTKGDEKTTFRFDMRPMLPSSSRLELVALTLVAGTAKLEEIIQNFESMGSWPEAFARAGLSFVDTSKRKTQVDASSTAQRSTIPDILYDVAKRTICWNQEALEQLMQEHVRLMGRDSTLEMTASDLVCLFMLARSSEWTGADQLFQPGPIGFAFTLEDGQQVSDSAASSLCTVLEKIDEAVPDRNNPMLKTAKSLAKFAATGGFTIRYRRSDSINTSATPRAEVTSKQAEQDLLGENDMTHFLSAIVPGDSTIEKQAQLLVDSGREHYAPSGSPLADAVTKEKRYQRLMIISVLLSLVTGWQLSSVTYRLTQSTILAVVGFVGAFFVTLLFVFWIASKVLGKR